MPISGMQATQIFFDAKLLGFVINSMEFRFISFYFSVFSHFDLALGNNKSGVFSGSQRNMKKQ